MKAKSVDKSQICGDTRQSILWDDVFEYDSVEVWVSKCAMGLYFGKVIDYSGDGCRVLDMGVVVVVVVVDCAFS